MRKSDFKKSMKAVTKFLDNGGTAILTRMSDPDYNRIIDSVMRFVKEGAGTHDIECVLCNAIEEAYELGFEDGKKFQRKSSKPNKKKLIRKWKDAR